MTPHGDGDRLLTMREVAVVIGYSEPSIKRFKREGILPPHVLIGSRAVRWWQSDIIAWIEQRRQVANTK